MAKEDALVLREGVQVLDELVDVDMAPFVSPDNFTCVFEKAVLECVIVENYLT